MGRTSKESRQRYHCSLARWANNSRHPHAYRGSEGDFVFAPDTRIKEHPIRIASGGWTAVTGFLEGTFSKPMPIGEGKTIPPTGKTFKLPMATIGHWKNGVMDEEWLFWDNQAFMKQIGLVQ